MIAKRRMLLDPLKVRYADAAVFMDIASVINSYELAGDVSLDQYESGLEPVTPGSPWELAGTVRTASPRGSSTTGQLELNDSLCLILVYFWLGN